MMETTGSHPRVKVDTPASGAVGQAGGIMLTETIAATDRGLEMSGALVRWRKPLAVHDPAKTITDLAVNARVGRGLPGGRRGAARRAGRPWTGASDPAADLRPALARESEGIPEVDLVIVPSSKALLGTTISTLVARAEAGAHVYVSWFAGVNANQRGRPALVRRRVGTGAIYLGAYPVEYYGAVRRNAHDDDQVHRLYAALATEAGIVADVHVNDPHVAVDELRHDDGTRYTWLISTNPEPLVVEPVVIGASRLEDVLTGEDLTTACALPPFGVRVARHVGLAS